MPERFGLLNSKFMLASNDIIQIVIPDYWYFRFEKPLEVLEKEFSIMHDKPLGKDASHTFFTALDFRALLIFEN